MRRIRAARDRGAMAIFVAIFVPVVLIGLGAIVIDVGQWYSARGQDQNGADAAAVAVAKTCVPGPCAPSAATAYVTGDKNGGLAHQAIVCGLSATGGLPTCASQNVPEDGTACPLPRTGNYVTVMVRPKNANDANAGTVTSFLGKGNQGIAACAQTSWGPAAFGGGLAITMSYCQWSTDTGNGNNASVYAPLPPYPPFPPAPAVEHVIQLGQIGDPTTCTPPQGASALPGGFGEVSQGGSCTTTVQANGWYSSNTGSGNSGQWVHDCVSVFDADIAARTVVGIPVFDDLSGNGNGGMYHLSNMLGFVMTGYRFKTGGGGTSKSYVTPGPYDTNNKVNAACSDTCIIGYYVKYTDPNSNPGSGQNFGVSTPPKLVG